MTWIIDPSHASVEFAGKHMMISTVRGRFEKFDAAVDLDTEDLTRSSVVATIDTTSLETRNERRDNQLKSPDFLDVVKYPTMTFRSARVEHVQGDRYVIRGDLTMRGVTRPVDLDTVFEGVQMSPWGTRVAGFTARSSISRKEWGLVWNLPLEAGGVMISDRIDISITLELIQQGKPLPVATGAVRRQGQL